jgi:hypothetical protein
MNYSRIYLSRLHRCVFAVFAVLLLLFMMLAAACSPSRVPSEPPPVPQTPSEQPPPDTTMRPTATWTADGVISSGEYTNTNTYGDYEINWTSDDKYVYIGLKVKTDGWVAVGIQPGLLMMDADIILGDISDGKVTVDDQFSTGNFGPHVSDVELGGTNDILEFGGKEAGGYTTIEFKRALDTGDKYDHPLVKGVNKIIWAYGSDDQVTVKHINRGYGELDL